MPPKFIDIYHFECERALLMLYSYLRIFVLSDIQILFNLAVKKYCRVVIRIIYEKRP